MRFAERSVSESRTKSYVSIYIYIYVVVKIIYPWFNVFLTGFNYICHCSTLW